MCPTNCLMLNCFAINIPVPAILNRCRHTLHSPLCTTCLISSHIALFSDNLVHDENPDGTGSRQRRQTQDRDERLRRGRRTLEDRAKKRSNTKKMSKKISFKRIATEDVSDDDCDSNHLKHNKKQRMEPPVSTNPLPIADRLQLMVARTRKGEAIILETYNGRW